MNKEEKNTAFAKMLDVFPEKFKRINFRERLMLRIAFDFGVDSGIESQNVPELKAEIAALKNQIEEIEHQAGFRCNQELQEMIKKLKCCANCNNYSPTYGLCVYSLGDEDYNCRLRKWELKEE